MSSSSIPPLGESESSTLTPLAPHDARRYGQLGTKMDAFHSHFKQEFAQLYDLADGGFSKHGMSLNMFLFSAVQFREHLHAHHTFEERSVFPILAKKMPSFRNDEQHRTSHKMIHDGLDSLGALVARFRADPTSYSPAEMRACLDGFRDVLMRHLDEEVRDLGAENMRKYWTLEEMESFPW